MPINDDVIRLLMDMIRHNTVNPPGNEEPLALLVATRLHNYEIPCEVIKFGDRRASFIGVLKGSGLRPALLYNGHLDTVPPGEVAWERDPFVPVIEGDRLYGRGAADMKSGLAAMVVAAGILARSGVKLRGDLIICGTAGEEVDGAGAQDLIARGYLRNVGQIVIGEPSDLKLFTAHKGAFWVEITTFGKTAHGSMPDLGNNAIRQMNALMNRLANLKFPVNDHPLLGGPTMNIGTIQGGVKTNVVPDRCTITVDFRSVPGMDHGMIFDTLKNLLDRLSVEIPGFAAQMRVINDKTHVETPVNSPLVQAAIRTGQSVLETLLRPQGVNYYTDASVFVPALNVPVILFGPGNEKLAHQPNEYVEIPKLLKAVDFYVELAKEVLA